MKKNKENAWRSIRILLVNNFSWPADGVSRGRWDDREEISVTVATVDEKQTGPRNWSFPYYEDRLANDTGGCSARLVPPSQEYADAKPLVSTEGPAVTHCSNPEEYRAAAKALEVIEKRLAEYREKRGPAADQVEQLARWCEATGAREVFSRPEEEGYRSTGWLSEGNWERSSIGGFVGRVRRLIKPKEIEVNVVPNRWSHSVPGGVE